MNRAERRRCERERKQTVRRKLPSTIEVVVGMLEGSTNLDGMAAKKREVESKEFGKETGQHVSVDGKLLSVVDITGGYSLGISISAQIIAGQAAELSLKYAYEAEHPNKYAETTHRLDVLYNQLSQDRKKRIEEDYAERMQRYDRSPQEGWETAQKVFHSGRDYPVLFRYATEEGRDIPFMQPVFLREAVCSVLASLETNIR